MPRLRAGNHNRVITLLLVVALVVVAVISLIVGVQSYHSYTFNDDFNGAAGSAPDPAKWTYDLGGGGWGNNELQTYTDSRKNSFLDGQGNLVIRATQHYDTYNSARLTTQGRFDQRYGHWEARMKINSQSGLWPAWWMLGNNFSTAGWPTCGEVDMVEDYGFSAVESSIHTISNDRLRNYSGQTNNDNEFHVFSMDWTPEGMTFSRDGEPYAQYSWDDPNGPSDPDRPMFMLLNLAVGGNIGDPQAHVVFPVDLVVDYVRVWR